MLLPVSEERISRLSKQRAEERQAVENARLRDEFAKAALTGMCAQFHEHWTKEALARNSYEIADAMMSARMAR
jgi:hypothetical protein